LAVRTVQRVNFLFRPLVEKFAFIHRKSAFSCQRSAHTNYCIFRPVGDRLDCAFDMAKKKKVKRFRAVKTIKELARDRVGAPPAGQVIKNKKERAEKHKPTLGKLLSSE
jgi:hypothetical protein